jgi:SAM-dependent methyltransferase
MTTTRPFVFDYDKKGSRYAGHRRTDPRIAAYVHRALGNARTVLNVGAGTGSYEPADRYVLAIEPSATMRAQRADHLPPALVGVAEMLPLDDKAVDASMAMVTLHHWADMEKGLLEMKRVTRHRILIMTFDGNALHEFWNSDYFPEVVAVEKLRYPVINWITGLLGGHCEVQSIPIPLDCVDGFQEAFYGRPEAFLDKEIRKAQSAWGFLSEEQQEILVGRLAADLQSGNWDKKFGHLRSQPWFTGALRLITADIH